MARETVLVIGNNHLQTYRLDKTQMCSLEHHLQIYVSNKHFHLEAEPQCSTWVEERIACFVKGVRWGSIMLHIGFWFV